MRGEMRTPLKAKATLVQLEGSRVRGLGYLYAWARGRRVSADAPQRHGARRILSLQADVVDAHFAGLNTIHYLLKVLVLDLQSVTDQ